MSVLFILILFLSPCFSAGTPHLDVLQLKGSSGSPPQIVHVQPRAAPPLPSPYSKSSIEAEEVDSKLLSCFEAAAKSSEGYKTLVSALGDSSLVTLTRIGRINEEALTPAAQTVRLYLQANLQLLHQYLTVAENFQLYERVAYERNAPSHVKVKALMRMSDLWERRAVTLETNQLGKLLIAIVHCGEIKSKMRTKACFYYMDHIANKRLDDKIGDDLYELLETIIPLNAVDTREYAASVFRQATVFDEYILQTARTDAISGRLRAIQNSVHLDRLQRRQIKLWLASCCCFCCLSLKYLLCGCEACD